MVWRGLWRCRLDTCYLDELGVGAGGNAHYYRVGKLGCLWLAPRWWATAFVIANLFIIAINGSGNRAGHGLAISFYCCGNEWQLFGLGCRPCVNLLPLCRA